jgi:hypothetical protein
LFAIFLLCDSTARTSASVIATGGRIEKHLIDGNRAADLVNNMRNSDVSKILGYTPLMVLLVGRWRGGTS